jgi:hypothetical protein
MPRLAIPLSDLQCRTAKTRERAYKLFDGGGMYLTQHMDTRAESTRYYYLLTIRLLTLRLGKPWQFKS